MRQISFLFLFSFRLFYSLAQTECNYKISGNVADADTREPLPFAKILIAETNAFTYADTNGNYVIKNLCAGDYTLIVSHFACEELLFKVKLNNHVLLNVVLPHKTNELREVTITDKHKEFGTSVKNIIQTEQLNTYKGLSIGEILQNVNGVQTLQTGNNIFKPVVNGLHGNRLQIINNGVRLESQQWGVDHAPELDAFSINQITVIKGAGALRYGSDALGGTIVAESNPLPFGGKTNSEFFTSFFSNNRMFGAYAMVEKNLKQYPAISWRLNLSARQGGNAKTPDYFLWNSGIKDFNATFNLGFRKPTYGVEYLFSLFSSTIGIFMGSQVGNIADLQLAVASPKPLFNKDQFSYLISRPRQEVLHLVNKLKYTYYKDPRHLLHLQLSVQANRRKEFDLAMISNAPELNLLLITTQNDIWYEHKHDYWQHVYGATFLWQENQWSGTRFFIPNYRNVGASAYHTSAFTKNNFKAEAGLRYDYRYLTTFRNNNGNFFSNFYQWQNLSGLINLNHLLTKSLMMGLNAGVSWRPPSVNELFVNGLHHGTSSFEIGNPALTNETGFKTGLQMTKIFADSLLTVDAFVYNNYISGFINLIPDTPPVLTIRGAYPTFRYVQNNANLTGVDMTIKIHPLKFATYQVSTSILYAKNTDNGSWLQQMPGNRLVQQITLLPNVNLKNNLQINMQYHTVFKQNRIPENFIDYLPPPPTYSLLHVSVTTYYKRLMLQLGINNLLNTAYREYLNRFRYFHDDTGRNFFIRLLYRLNPN